jgi:hypothetical protein
VLFLNFAIKATFNIYFIISILNYNYLVQRK